MSEQYVTIEAAQPPTQLVKITEPSSQGYRSIMCTKEQAIEIANQIITMFRADAL